MSDDIRFVAKMKEVARSADGTDASDMLWAASSYINDLSARLEKAEAERDGWQPIKTAPKDGTHILLYAGPQTFRGELVGPRLTYGYWLIEEHGEYLGDCGGECRCPEYGDTPEPFWMSEDGGFTEENPPTHWRPLPSPPTPPQGDEA